MENFRDRIYNYEQTPPEGVWESIAEELDRTEAKVIPIERKKNNTVYYLVAASVAVILFSWIYFSNRDTDTTEKQMVSTPANDTGGNKDNSVIMTVPFDEKMDTKNDQKTIVKNKTSKENPVERINKQPEDSQIMAMNTPRYITIEGPEGQPVKISSKMAMLIDSAETKTPSKPIWHKKISEWKEIMKVNTLAPTPGNFLDIVELTKTLKDKDK